MGPVLVKGVLAIFNIGILSSKSHFEMGITELSYSKLSRSSFHAERSEFNCDFMETFQKQSKTTNQITILRPDFLVSEPKRQKLRETRLSLSVDQNRKEKKLISGSPSSFRNCQNYCCAISNLRDLLNKQID